MQIHFPLFSVSKTCKKNSPPKFEGQTKKEKRRRRTFNGSIFSETRLLSRNSLFKKNHPNAGRVYTHTRAHTHTLLSLSICKLSEHCCCCCCCELSGVFSSSLSLFLSKKKKGEEKRKTTEDHPKTVVQRGGSNPKERSNF